MAASSSLRVLCPLFAAAVGIAAYTATLDCGFCFDDKSAILENKDVIGESPWVSLLWNDFWGQPINSNTSHKSYRPLCVATFRLNYLLHELQPMGYHLVNVLLHGAVCYLYVQLCSVVFSQVWPALIAGLLFAVHPIHTEAVAGIVGRADLMASLFFLITFLFYHQEIVEANRIADTPLTIGCATSCRRPLISCMIFLLCSVASKELGLTVVGVCFIYDLFLINKVSLNEVWKFFTSHRYKGRSPFKRQFLSRTVPVLVFSMVILIGRLWLMKSTPHFTKYDNEALSLSTPFRQLHWSYLVFLNSYLLLHPSLLLHDYRMGAVPLINYIMDPRIFLILVTGAVYGGLLFYSFSSSKLSWSTPSQLSVNDNRTSTNHHVKGHMTNDVITNSSDVIMNGTAAFSITEGTRKRRKVTKAAALSGYPNLRQISEEPFTDKEVLLFGLSLMIIPFVPASNLFFPVGFVVAERVLYLPSMGFCLLVAYGAYRLTQSRLPCLSILARLSLFLLLLSHGSKTLRRSRDWYSKEALYKSLMVNLPTNGHVIGNLALKLHRSGDDITAERLNRYAMKVAPDVPLSFVNLGSMMKQQGRLDEAEQVWREAVRVLVKEEQPQTDKIAQIYSSLCGMVSGHTHRLSEALKLCDLAVSARPDLSGTHNRRGAVLTKMGRHGEAKLAFEQALAMEPRDVNVMFNLALAHENLGDISVAMEILRNVLIMDHAHQLAKDELMKLINAHNHNHPIP